MFTVKEQFSGKYFYQDKSVSLLSLSSKWFLSGMGIDRHQMLLQRLVRSLKLLLYSLSIITPLIGFSDHPYILMINSVWLGGINFNTRLILILNII